MSKSELKRLCTLNPLEMAKKMHELEQQLAAVAAERDEANAQIKTNEQIIQGILTINAEHKLRAEAAEAENAALKARIAEAEKQAPFDSSLRRVNERGSVVCACGSAMFTRQQQISAISIGLKLSAAPNATGKE